MRDWPDSNIEVRDFYKLIVTCIFLLFIIIIITYELHKLFDGW